eukprot:TRINITY_DN1401_c0_g1_i3.p1 TRINITY_DN1401_c0_g1~~TRINITY_DN1401_c0_g1_i3.p1  ORF type:complete len:708 (+),score=109.02 TRINITY_DN1401_c0_g1_i3:61-2124(+)
MFLVKTVTNWLWKDQKDLVEVRGSFFDFYKSQWRCLLNNARCTLSRGEQPFTYKLVVSRVENPDEEYDPSDATTFTFELSQSFSMRREEHGALGNVGYSWADSLGKGFLFELDEETTDTMKSLFETTVCKSAWEAAQKMTFPEDGDLEELTERHLRSIAPPSVPSSSSIETTAATSGTEKEQPASHWAGAPPSPIRTTEIKIGSVLYEANALVEGSQIGKAGEGFKAKVKASIAVDKKLRSRAGESAFSYILNLKNEDGELVFGQLISNDMQMQSKPNKIVEWICNDDASATWSFILQFETSEDHNRFKYIFGKCLWEAINNASFETVSEENMSYLLSTMDDLNIDDRDDDDEEFEDDNEFRSVSKPSFSSQGKNTALAVGYKHNDRSFVARGNEVGVFRMGGEDGALEYQTSLSLKTPTGTSFTPSKLMLHQQDNNLLMLNPSAKNSIYKIDLNRTDVVEEWNTAEGFPIQQILGEQKYSQMEMTPTFVGLHQQGMFKIDPRLPKFKQVDTRSLAYKTKGVELSCAATTSRGQMAIGSKDGKIRFFSENALGRDIKDVEDRTPRAKTTLPGFGDPIIGVDVTRAGDWVLATCKSYLLLIPTQVKSSTGFEVSMGKEKPNPKRLQLQKEHIAAMGGTVSFTPGRFNTGAGEETSIVTSSGPFIISWSLQKVKQGKLNTYRVCTIFFF